MNLCGKTVESARRMPPTKQNYLFSSQVGGEAQNIDERRQVLNDSTTSSSIDDTCLKSEPCIGQKRKVSSLVDYDCTQGKDDNLLPNCKQYKTSVPVSQSNTDEPTPPRLSNEQVDVGHVHRVELCDDNVVVSNSATNGVIIPSIKVPLHSTSTLDGLVLWEPVDGNIIEKLIQSNLLRSTKSYNNYGNSSEISQLQNYLKNYDISKQAVKVVYHKDGKGIGRVYANKSLSLGCIRKQVKNTIINSGLDWVDIDMVNAHPNILLQICEFHGIVCEKLRYYCINRDVILMETMKEYEISREDAKELFIVLLYGGTFYGWQKGHSLKKRTPTTFIQSFTHELKTIGDVFISENPELVVLIKERKAKHGDFFAYKNIKGSVVSCVLQEYEYRILETIYQHMVGNGYIVNDVAVLCYDGIMFPKQQYKDKVLDELRDVVKVQVGFDVKFVVKPFGVNYMDILYPNQSYVPAIYNGRHCFNDHTKSNSWDQYELFHRIDALSKEDVKQKQFLDIVVPWMNNVFGFLQGERSQILQRRILQDGEVEYISRTVANTIETFQDQRYKIWTGDYRKDKKGKPTDEKIYTQVDIFKHWIQSKEKLTYERRVFNPREYHVTNAADVREFNNFSGFQYQPTEIYDRKTMERLRQNELKVFFDHIDNVWCSNNIKAYQYVVLWLASTVVYPWKKIKVSLVLKSLPGAGKGTIIEILKKIMGKQYVSTPTSLDDVTTKEFNSFLLETCLLMFLDECFFVGDKRVQKSLMKLQSEDTVIVSKKFHPKYQIANQFNTIMATNEEHGLHLQRGQRRNFVLECSDVHNNDADYFQKLRNVDLQLLTNYFYSMKQDLDEWNSFDVPVNAATMDQQERSFDAFQQVLADILNDPSILTPYRVWNDEDVSDDDDLTGKYCKKSIYEKLYTTKTRHPKSQCVFWNDLKKIIPSIDLSDRHKYRYVDIQNGSSYVRTVAFSSLQQAREEFKRSMRMPLYTFE